jgi:hypothetical protein
MLSSDYASSLNLVNSNPRIYNHEQNLQTVRFHALSIHASSIQGKSENRTFENQKHLETGLFLVWSSNGLYHLKTAQMSGFEMVSTI